MGVCGGWECVVGGSVWWVGGCMGLVTIEYNFHVKLTYVTLGCFVVELGSCVSGWEKIGSRYLLYQNSIKEGLKKISGIFCSSF